MICQGLKGSIGLSSKIPSACVVAYGAQHDHIVGFCPLQRAVAVAMATANKPHAVILHQ